MKTPEESRRRIAEMSDEEAQEHGYPSAEVMRLEYRLGDIAAEWRGTKRDELIAEYKYVLYEMILKGYDVNGLDIEDQLPPEHMPDLPPKKVLEGILKSYSLTTE